MRRSFLSLGCWILGICLCCGVPLSAWGAPFFASYEVTRHGDEGEIFLEDFAGTPVIMVFFYPTCEDCMEELRMFQEMKPELESRKITLLPVTKERFNPRFVSRTLEKEGITALDVYYDHMPGMFDVLPVRSVPRLVAFDAGGTQIYDHEGPVSEILLEDLLDDLVPPKGE